MKNGNKTGWASFPVWVAAGLLAIAAAADFLANEKPLAASVDGKLYFPVLRGYLVSAGIKSWPEELNLADWKKLNYGFVIRTPVPYSPHNLDALNSGYKSPFDRQDVTSLWWRHWLGTDEIGRDVLSGMIHGTRVAVAVGVIAVGIALLIGLILGSLAGYFGDNRVTIRRGGLWMLLLFLLPAVFYAFIVRWFALQVALGSSVFSFTLELIISMGILFAVLAAGFLLSLLLNNFRYFAGKVTVPVDIAISRLIDIVETIPRFFLIISIVVIASPSIFLVMAVIGFTSWTTIARFIRAELLKIRELGYIEAARALGYPEWRTLLVHALPNGLTPVIIAAAFGMAAAIITESSMSFLGIGVSPSTVTWGSMLAQARAAPGEWWLAAAPGTAIFISVTVFNLIGDRLSLKLTKGK